jgi:hypothetical protein
MHRHEIYETKTKPSRYQQLPRERLDIKLNLDLLDL